ncbi:hypothetical protein C8J57DRAFT_1274474 [Mycena rebaudengoi]|nr:hypothetical protein C8J57DRAFT_1274474 [Mycena rebaudengoi]
MEARTARGAGAGSAQGGAGVGSARGAGARVAREREYDQHESGSANGTRSASTSGTRADSARISTRPKTVSSSSSSFAVQKSRSAPCEATTITGRAAPSTRMRAAAPPRFHRGRTHGRRPPLRDREFAATDIEWTSSSGMGRRRVDSDTGCRRMDACVVTAQGLCVQWIIHSRTAAMRRSGCFGRRLGYSFCGATWAEGGEWGGGRST